MRDPWVCRCGHEFAFTGIGTKNCVQVPHACPFDVVDMYDVTDYEPEDEDVDGDESGEDCMGCGMCEWCIELSIAYAEDQQ